MTVLTEDMIERRTKGTRLDRVENLNVWGCDIHDISVIKNLTNLKILGLSMNLITDLEPLRNLQHLETLYLRQNLIRDIQQLRHLQTLPKLAFLWLSDNPFCEALGSDYRREVLCLLPNLKSLDRTTIEIEEPNDIPQNESTHSETESNSAATSFRAAEPRVLVNLQNSINSTTRSTSGIFFPLLRGVFTKRAEHPVNRLTHRTPEYGRVRHTHSYMDLRHMPGVYGNEGVVHTTATHFTQDRGRANLVEAAMNILTVLDSQRLHMFEDNINRILEESRLIRRAHTRS